MEQKIAGLALRNINYAPQDREDLLQDAAAEFARVRYRGKRPTPTQLRRAAYWMMLRCVHRQQRQRPPEVISLSEQDEECPAPLPALTIEELCDLRQALSELHRRDRWLLLVVICRGWTCAEIGRVFGWTRFPIHRRVQQILHNLRSRLGEAYETTSCRYSNRG
jgi:RNA polymerase sigma factor (sigma-70 family)